MDINTLKKTLKKWENDFYKANNRKPTKVDIKENKEIEQKYKDYRDLKSGKPVKTKTKSHHHGRHSKEKRTVELSHTPAKSSESVPNSSPSKVEEVGPTPQLSGRILDLFEIYKSGGPKTKMNKQATSILGGYTSPVTRKVLATPEKTPSHADIGESPNNKIVLTPSVKRKIDFSEIMSDEENEDEVAFKKPVTTPTHTRLVNINLGKNTPTSVFRKARGSTPTYIRHRSVIFEESATENQTSEISVISENDSAEMSTNITAQSEISMMSLVENSSTPVKDKSSANASLISPSVFKFSGNVENPVRKRKKLSDLFNEVQQMSMSDDELTQQIIDESNEQWNLGDNDDFRIMGAAAHKDRMELVGSMGTSINEFENELQKDQENKENQPAVSYKKKIKRQTRRVKMKGRGLHDEEAVEEEDVSKETQKMLTETDKEVIEEDEDYVSGSDEEVEQIKYTEKDTAADKKYRPVSNNYKRYKLKKRNFGRRNR